MNNEKEEGIEVRFKRGGATAGVRYDVKGPFLMSADITPQSVLAKIKAAPVESDVWLTEAEAEALNSLFPPSAQPGRIVFGRALDRNIHVKHLLGCAFYDTFGAEAP